MQGFRSSNVKKLFNQQQERKTIKGNHTGEKLCTTTHNTSLLVFSPRRAHAARPLSRNNPSDCLTEGRVSTATERRGALWIRSCVSISSPWRRTDCVSADHFTRCVPYGPKDRKTFFYVLPPTNPPFVFSPPR
ncbi:hypothetical protein F2P81_018705 [Scophthalmus maximus]|uniref:Uncharacterized protein n=1 Tax=Scophthalmus maximus TaxID=52904 RepID=A0A6A4SCU7_SCOMX|nr:hypothetical protein F2P81_018705 [Scophthalmus maximus]